MSRAEGVVFAFLASRESGDAAPHAQLAHALTAAGEYLVSVRLVADVPHDTVVRRIEHVMQRDRQLDRSQVGRQMAPRLAYRVEQKLSQFAGQTRQLTSLELSQLVGVSDRFQKLVHRL